MENYILENDIFDPEHEEEFLEHEGVSKRDGAKIGSGRFPYGSGKNPFQHLSGLYGEYRKLKAKGFSDAEIGAQYNMSSGDLRSRLAYYQAIKNSQSIKQAVELADKGYSNLQIAQKMGVSASTVANYLKASTESKEARIISTRNALKDKIDEVGWVEIGKGTENWMGVKRTLLDAAATTLYDEGYELYSDLRVKQGGTGKFTTVKALAKPGMTRGDVLADKANIYATMADVHSFDGGKTFKKKGPPVNVDSKRIEIRYADDPISGKDMDGTIELRRGVPDLDLGNAHYAQVRIAVDGKYYAKGVAFYADDLPDGVDIRVNSNKLREKGIEGALKPQKSDKMNPFGTNTKEEYELERVSNFYTDENGKEHQSALNFVNEEGTWEKWDKNLPSQFLGKQPPALARQQLNIDASGREREFDEIKKLTNPVLRQTLLEDFAGNCDSAAVHLKAASLPRQATAVIVPAKSLKENEVYAPWLDNGEEVVLVRFPHGGIFEIPRLKVNNKNREAKNRIGSGSADAICINPKTAGVLSGADFDGDTVLVLPTKNNGIVNKEPYKELKEFDHQTIYATTPEERKALKIWDKGSRREQTEMGKISNLITDMTLQGAPDDELIRAVKHSMVIIDTGKHKLDYKRSYQDNRIKELVQKYQPHYDEKADKMRYGGASTLLSRSKKDVEVQAVKSYYKINEKGKDYYDPTKPEGAKLYVPDTSLKPKRKKTDQFDPKTGKPIYETLGYVPKTRKSTMMMEAEDAYTLTSGGSKRMPGTEIEATYAEYANRMKALGNEARKAAIKAGYEQNKKNSTASKTYAREVDHLMYQMNEAKKNAPLERRALALAQSKVEIAKQESGWTMSKGEESKMLDKEVKKAREIVGASRYQVHISDKEWEAIQAGAIAPSVQKELFKFVDKDRLRELAMPKTQPKLTKSYVATAKSMLDRGYTLEEVAKRFGVSPSTISEAVKS